MTSECAFNDLLLFVTFGRNVLIIVHIGKYKNLLDEFTTLLDNRHQVQQFILYKMWLQGFKLKFYYEKPHMVVFRICFYIEMIFGELFEILLIYVLRLLCPETLDKSHSSLRVFVCLFLLEIDLAFVDLSVFHVR